MGWFSKKKKPLPRPSPSLVDDSPLNFSPEDLKADDLKAAAGVLDDLSTPASPAPEPVMETPAAEPSVPEPAPAAPEPSVPAPVMSAPSKPSPAPRPMMPTQIAGELHMHVDGYKLILGNLDEAYDGMSELQKLTKNLLESEYNEQKNFHALKSCMKELHDKLLSADEVMFR